ncbi:MAG: hypothetical protein ACO1ON_12985 [Nocardioides sp.]
MTTTEIRTLVAKANRLLRDADRLHAHTRASIGDEISAQEAGMRETAAALFRKADRLAS